MSTAFEVVQASSDDLADQCKACRVAVFVDEQKFSLEDEVDEYDGLPTTIHLLLRTTPDSKPAGTLRLYPHPSHPSSAPPSNSSATNIAPDDHIKHYKIGRVCILEQYRKHKLGALLMNTGHDILRKRVFGEAPECAEIEITLHSQIPAMGFYQRFGYEPFGDEFMEDGQPHRSLRTRLSRTPVPSSDV